MRRAALSAHYYITMMLQKKLVVYPTAAAAAAARPPQPINRAVLGAVGSCCRPFDFTTHTAVVCCVCCGAKVALPALIVTQKMGGNKRFKTIIARTVAGHLLIDKQVTPRVSLGGEPDFYVHNQVTGFQKKRPSLTVSPTCARKAKCRRRLQARHRRRI